MRFKEALPEANNWLNNNYLEIIKGMKSALQSRASDDLIFHDEINPCFSPSNRTYSEMPLCSHVWNIVSPPSGFEVIPLERGRVHIVDSKTGKAVAVCNHAYAKNPDGVIICLTPGLFEAHTEDNLFPGERLARLQKKAPNLISIQKDGLGRNGIAVLHGKKKVIADTLFLEYSEV